MSRKENTRRKKDPAAVALGKRRAAKMTPEERKASARKAALARWRKKKTPAR